MDLRRQYKLIFSLRLDRLSYQLISIILIFEICRAKGTYIFFSTIRVDNQEKNPVLNVTFSQSLF